MLKRRQKLGNQLKHKWWGSAQKDDNSQGKAAENPIAQTQSFNLNNSDNPTPMSRLWKSTGNLLFGGTSDVIAAKRSRSIKFNPNVKVVLIPARKDYETSNLAGSLWWLDHEYQEFKSDAVVEIRNVMSRYLLTPKDAALRLYQKIEIYERLTGVTLNQLQALEYEEVHNNKFGFTSCHSATDFGGSKEDEKEEFAQEVVSSTNYDTANNTCAVAA